MKTMKNNLSKNDSNQMNKQQTNTTGNTQLINHKSR